MKNLVVRWVLLVTALSPSMAFSASQVPTSLATAGATAPASIKDWLGLQYAIRFSGPPLAGGDLGRPINHMGRPADDGWNTFNRISFRFKFWEKMALDLQLRTYTVFNDGVPGIQRKESFRPIRWETPGVGVSGTLARGEEWTLKGAINTDTPYFLPLAGYSSMGRTTLINPGLWAFFNWTPKNSRFSVFSSVGPRYYLYRDRNAQDEISLRGGRVGLNKREFELGVGPTLNYKVAKNFDASIGLDINYNKQVGSDWNPLRASLIQNELSPAWHLDPMQLQLGGTYHFSEEVRLFLYGRTFPIAGQRIDRRNGKMAGFMETAAVGFDIVGTLY